MWVVLSYKYGLSYLTKNTIDKKRNDYLMEKLKVNLYITSFMIRGKANVGFKLA